MNKVLIYAVAFFVLVLLGVGLFLFLRYGGQTQSVIPVNCYTSEHVDTSISFTCPSDAVTCSGKAWLKCDIPTITPKVIFRASDGDYTKIAVDTDNDGDLEGYKKSTGWTSCVYDTSLVVDKLVLSPKVYFRRSDSNVFVCFGNQAYKYLPLSSGISLSPSPIGGIEIYSSASQNIFTCSQASSGDASVFVSDARAEKWENFAYFTLDADKRINWNGLIAVDISHKLTSQCIGRMPNSNVSNSFFECNVNPNTGCGVLASMPSFCPSGQFFDNSAKICKASYDYDIKLDKSAMVVGSRVSGYVVVSASSQISNIPVRVCIKSIQKGDEICISGNTGVDGRYVFNLPAQYDVGTYDVYAVINHPLSDITTTFLKVVYVDTFNIHLYVDDQIQNTGDVVVWAVVTNNAGKPKSDVTLSFSGSICGVDDISGRISSKLDNIKDDGAYYKVIGRVDKACQATFVVTARDETGFVLSPVRQVVNVETSSIIIRQLNKDVFQNPTEGTYTFEFMILDADLSPIANPDSIDVKVQDRGGCVSDSFCTSEASPNFNKNVPKITAVPIDISKGMWKFTHKFDYGMNFISVTVDSYGLQSHTYKESFNFWQSDVPAPTVCADGSNPPCTDTSLPVGLILTIVLVSVGVVIFMVIVFRRKK